MSRLINPYQTFRDTAGEVVSDGTLEFYETGTTTAKAYYSDADLTTSGGTSYTLDGYGRVTADVWLDGDYRIIVKDSAGATVYTIDDVSSISTTATGGGGTETVQGSVQNKFVNGACRVESDGGSITMSGSYQESGVAEISVKAQGTPTNGTADRTKTTECGTSGYALLVDELTTGAGGTVDYRFRFNSVDSRDLVNSAAIFQCNVLQKTGASKVYTISIYKANAEDNFGGTTLISASSGTSVSDSTDTKISHSVSDMGDCSNGIEVIVSVACGATTTIDFLLADVVFRKGQSLITFEQEPYSADFSHIKFSAVKDASDAGPQGYLNGLDISNNTTDSQHDIDIATGVCRAENTAAGITLSSGLTKRIDANWSAGTGNGGFPSGLTLTADTWYRVFVIATTSGTVDVGFDTSSTAANLLTDASSYTLYRRIGWVKTDSSSNIIQFRQHGDWFEWFTDDTTSLLEENAGADNDITLNAPPSHVAQFTVNIATTGSSAGNVLFTSTSSTQAADADNFDVRYLGGDSTFTKNILIDSSSQIRVAVSNAADYDIYYKVQGWWDNRGK